MSSTREILIEEAKQSKEKVKQLEQEIAKLKGIVSIDEEREIARSLVQQVYELLQQQKKTAAKNSLLPSYMNVKQIRDTLLEPPIDSAKRDRIWQMTTAIVQCEFSVQEITSWMDGVEEIMWEWAAPVYVPKVEMNKQEEAVISSPIILPEENSKKIQEATPEKRVSWKKDPFFSLVPPKSPTTSKNKELFESPKSQSPNTSPRLKQLSSPFKTPALESRKQLIEALKSLWKS